MMKHTLALIVTLCLTAVAFAQAGDSCTCAECACGAVGSTLSITAQGTVEIDPDRAVVRAGVTEEAKTAREAMDAVNRKLTRAREEIKDLDVRGAQLSTSSVSVYPIYDNSREGQARQRETGETQVIGYRASNTLSVRIDDIKRVGEVIDEAVKAGVNQLQGVSFMSRDPFAAQTEALAQATMRAKTKANVMAGAMGATIKRVIDAREAGAASPPPSPRRSRLMMESAASDFSPTPIDPGTLTLNASVSITYELSFGEAK